MSLSKDELADIESLAVELAAAAGATITASLSRTLAVKYKASDDTDRPWRDPVSEVDGAVEVMIRARLADRFPSHDILGEEIAERPVLNGDVIWSIDPVDGTTNFISGFPLFSCSIGILDKGRPVAGALWCSTSHALRSGTYHTRLGRPVSFDGTDLDSAPNPAVRNRLVGVPKGGHAHGGVFDTRQTGSSAIECAFVAAGLMSAARFERPNVWDVAGGIALVLAAGGTVLVGDGEGRFRPFEGFMSGPGAARDPGEWRRPLIIGHEATVREIAEREEARAQERGETV